MLQKNCANKLCARWVRVNLGEIQTGLLCNEIANIHRAELTQQYFCHWMSKKLLWNSHVTWECNIIQILKKTLDRTVKATLGKLEEKSKLIDGEGPPSMVEQKLEGLQLMHFKSKSGIKLKLTQRFHFHDRMSNNLT